MCALSDELVLSDVHRESVCPVAENHGEITPVSSRFPFSPPSTQDGEKDEDASEASSDEDGDMVVSRSQRNNIVKDVITIEHTMSTQISKVGLQVWMASFLLCDFILSNASLFSDECVLELGGGTGLCSVLLASLNPSAILCTDTGLDVLAQCQRNIASNGHLTGQVTPRVKELDWTKDHLVTDTHNAFHWTNEDRSLLQRVRYIVAADVIYDDRLTDAFFRALQRLMRQNHTTFAFVALEKRLNFTIDGLRVRSPSHEHFLHRVDALRKEDGFSCQRVETTFPHCFEYTRTKELELWQFSYSSGDD